MRLTSVLAVVAAVLTASAPSAAAAAPDPLTCAGYAEPRQFVEAQSWWTPTPGAPTRPNTDFGHGHLGGCIPERETVTGPTPLDVRIVLHENPGVVAYASIVSMDRRGDTTRVKDLSVRGMTCPHGTCERWVRFELSPGWFAGSGLNEVRYRLFIDEPDGNRMTVSLNWQLHIANGAPRADVTRNPYLRGKGWYTGSGYCEAALRTVPLPDAAVSGSLVPWRWSLRWHGTAADLPVTRASVRLDADFHAVPPIPGLLLHDGGPFEGVVPFPVALPPARHRVQARADCDDPRGATNSGVLVVGLPTA
jgi:hypothetical protein